MTDNEEKIMNGICISNRGTDHCPYCVDCCEASQFRIAIKELKDIAEDKKPDLNKE
jgi:hypothetical protein